MKPVILDCSVALSWCFQDESSSYSDSVLEYTRKNSALVPPLWLSEITNGLLGATRKRRLDWDGSLFFLEKIARLPIRIAALSAKEYFTNIIQLAEHEKLTTYDATYLYLAIREKRPLATLDAALRKAARDRKLPKL